MRKDFSDSKVVVNSELSPVVIKELVQCLKLMFGSVAMEIQKSEVEDTFLTILRYDPASI